MKEYRVGDRFILSTAQMLRRPKSRRSIFESPVKSHNPNPQQYMFKAAVADQSDSRTPTSNAFVKSTSAYKLLEQQIRILNEQNQLQLQLLKNLYNAKVQQVQKTTEAISQMRKEAMEVNCRVEQLQDDLQEEEEANAELHDITDNYENGEYDEDEEGNTIANEQDSSINLQQQEY